VTKAQRATEAVADVVIVGGGLGGVAAALGVLRSGASVVLTEETDWIGGQMTSQGVPPDEHSWIEQFGCTAAYRELREGIREYYRRWYPLTPEASHARFLNPGAGLVGKLCHEPQVALAVMQALLAPFAAAGQLRVLLRHRPVEATVDHDRVTSVTVASVDSGDTVTLRGAYVLDATETGALLPLTGTEHVSGAESQAETGERHAAPEARPTQIQAVTVCFAIDYLPGETHVIERPGQYDRWRTYQPSFWPDRFFSFTDVNPRTLQPVRHSFRPNPFDDPTAIIADQGVDPGSDDLWRYRRILARRNFQEGAFRSDLCLVNWANNDYFEGPVYGGSPEEDARHVEAARQLSLSLLYWLQTEAPRSDGGIGYPGLRLRPDIMGTADGLAKAPYIREARRIKALATVVEQDIARADRPEGRARVFADSVGVGHYRIDLHPAVGGSNFIDLASCPFQIPLSALVPLRMRNLLAAGKSLGTTHITNGAYRLHPVEWNVGESAGILAAYCISKQVEPQQVQASPDRVADFQRTLRRHGVEIGWPSLVCQ
jgi:hypothetical protein